MGVREPVPNHESALDAQWNELVFRFRLSSTVRHTSPFDLPTLSTASGGKRLCRHDRSLVDPALCQAQTMRAILLARATITSMGGLRASIRPSHDFSEAPRRRACRTTALAPLVSRRRSVRSPILEVAPSFCFPPVECCNGVSPSHAAKSRPRLKLVAWGAKAISAVAVIGPTPGSSPVAVPRHLPELAGQSRRRVVRFACPMPEGSPQACREPVEPALADRSHIFRSVR